ncbi:hypothetical protein QBC35DRAFT_505177, partial [Podospora australis]
LHIMGRVMTASPDSGHASTRRSINGSRRFLPYHLDSSSRGTRRPQRLVQSPRVIVTRSVARREEEERAMEAHTIHDFEHFHTQALEEFRNYKSSVNRTIGPITTPAVVGRLLQSIAQQTKPWSSYATKLNAAGTIGNIINGMLRTRCIFANGQIKPWGDILIEVVDQFTPEEKAQLMAEHRHWLEQWKLTITMAEGHYYEETLRLREAVQIMKGEIHAGEDAEMGGRDPEDNYEADDEDEDEDEEEDGPIDIKIEEEDDQGALMEMNIDIKKEDEGSDEDMMDIPEMKAGISQRRWRRVPPKRLITRLFDEDLC